MISPDRFVEVPWIQTDLHISVGLLYNGHGAYPVCGFFNLSNYSSPFHVLQLFFDSVLKACWYGSGRVYDRCYCGVTSIL